MNKLLTQRDLCELLRVQYSTLNRWLNAGTFPQPVNGRGKKLLFDPDAIEDWVKSRQQPAVPIPTPSTKRRRDKNSFEQRQVAAQAVLQRHATER